MKKLDKNSLAGILIVISIILAFSCKKKPSLPVITTANITSITQTTASSGGNVTSDGGAEVTVKGVCWGITPKPIIANSKTNDGTGIGSFTSNLEGLTPNTLYYVRAYAINSAGTTFGNEISFTTSSYPKWVATQDYYNETEPLNSIVTELYGSNYRIADWNDLVNYSQTHDISAWADSIGMLKSSSYGFLVTRDGSHYWSGNRHYWIDRHDGVVPYNWLVHATINNHFIDLGSWYSIKLRLLCYRIN
ncbi:MAG: hypothetical protein MUO72_10485 [Bacteroidales bacterium]|nr:hypothetical protein [Bacteroidales bacterium]